MNYFGAITLFLVAVTGPSFAQVGAPCHNRIFTFTPRHSLNLTAFQGTWFAHEYASSFIGNTPEPDYKCLNVRFTQDDELHLTADESFTNLTTGGFVQDTTSITVNATRSPLNAVWTATSPNLPGIVIDQVVLAADLTFTRWALLYGCSIRDGGFRWETVTAVTRARTIDQTTRDDLKALMVGIGFRIGDHWPIGQTGCLA